MPNNIILRADPEYFKLFTAFNRKTFESISITSEDFAVLRTISQSSIPIDDLIGLLLILFCEKKKVDEWLGFYIMKGIIELSAVPNIYNLPQPIIENYFDFPVTSTPTEVEICLTRRCNLSCVHCNITSRSEFEDEVLPTNFWLEIFKQCEQNQVLKVIITGGEPFIRKDWCELLDYLSKASFGTIILTNGIHFDDSDIDKLSSSFITLSISLDGINSQQHDTFRKRSGAFEKTVNNMRKLSRKGVAFTISSVVHDGNVNDLLGLLKIAEDVGAKKLIVVPMVAIGRGKSHLSRKWFPKNSNLLLALDNLQSVANSTKGPELIIGNSNTKENIIISNRYSGATAMSKRNPGYCKAGIYSMAIDEDGVVYSCLRALQSKSCIVGDLKSQSLIDIWRSNNWKIFRDPTVKQVPCRAEYTISNHSK